MWWLLTIACSDCSSLPTSRPPKEQAYAQPEDGEGKGSISSILGVWQGNTAFSPWLCNAHSKHSSCFVACQTWKLQIAWRVDKSWRFLSQDSQAGGILCSSNRCIVFNIFDHVLEEIYNQITYTSSIWIHVQPPEPKKKIICPVHPISGQQNWDAKDPGWLGTGVCGPKWAKQTESFVVD